ncbi:glycosyltransferase [Gaetbulibacter saemankumensis]|uniref:glycosyltransferase n=1 Tax=Gaetbulibacter saemankumensis TaxID=311208 RepID=UPI00041288D4|nr:glycosyltransferase [Gaetbulibacter saemankumensis]
MPESQKKIKILFTIPNFDTAGSGKVVYDLARGLDKALFEVHIACNHKRGAFFKTVEALGVPIHIIKTTINYRPYLSLLKRLVPGVRFFKSQQFDIIHSWDWSSDWTEGLAARLAGIKWVYTKKAMSWGHKHWKIRSFLAHYIITINNQMCDFFPWKQHQKLIPLGIDTQFYSPDHFKASQEPYNNSAYHIITVANLVPVKGIEILIKAVSLLENPKVKLSIIGDNTGHYGDYLKELCKTMRLDQQVVFLGKQTDVRPYLVTADLFVIPTLNKGRREGMPMALVEAMSMGIPVLGSDIAGINFVLKDFPELLFESGNVEVLADKIRLQMQYSKAQHLALGMLLRAYCNTHFTYELFIKQHEDLYLEILRKPQPKAEVKLYN